VGATSTLFIRVAHSFGDDAHAIHAGSFGTDQVWALENVPEPGTVGVVAAGFLALTLLGCRRPVRQR